MEKYDKNGEEISTDQLENYLRDPEYKIIAQTTVGEFWVSTVWLGVDHSFTLTEKKPVIFETMVFSKEKSLACRRYSTEKEAVIGHSSMVQKWSKRD